MMPTHPIDPSSKQEDLRTLLGAFPAHRIAIRARRNLDCSGFRAEKLDLTRHDGAAFQAILTGPAGEWKGRPAVLYCHAHGNRFPLGAEELISGRPALFGEPYASALAADDIVALSIDMPCFASRQSETEASAAKRHLWQGRTLFGEMIADQIAALDFLVGLGGVDPQRVGVMGFSMGATLAFWLGALDTRIKAVAHLCAFADIATLIEAGAHDLHGPYMTVPGLLSHFRTGEIAGLIAPRPQFAGMGRLDPLTPEPALGRAIADLEAAYHNAERRDALTIHVEPESGHLETPAMRAAVRAFLRRHLLAGSSETR